MLVIDFIMNCIMVVTVVVVQWLEHSLCDQEVMGSSPAHTMDIKLGKDCYFSKCLASRSDNNGSFGWDLNNRGSVSR